MDISVLVFLASGLFLGWSLGANDAANVFGTAVGTRMITFATAAAICSVFVILGAVVSGAGAAQTLGRLGTINALPGAFMAALSAALAVYGMTKLGLSVSTTQAIVGAIIGWNLFSGFPTDPGSFATLAATWIACPILAAVISVVLYTATLKLVRKAKLHLFRLDAYTRLALILAGAFGAYSLGANNIANVMGVFVPANPFTTFRLEGLLTFSAREQLFLLGALAIAVGVITYSKRVMLTVGSDLLPLSPVGAWVAVVAHSLVLFLFASEGLEFLLASAGLPTIPLVPVSSSQAVVGAVLGIGLVKGGRAIRWRVLGNLASGWVTTPVISCAICFVSLFFLQNVFNQEVYRDRGYILSEAALARLEARGLPRDPLADLEGFQFLGAADFRSKVAERVDLSVTQEQILLDTAEIVRIEVDPALYPRLYRGTLSAAQIGAVTRLGPRSYRHRWAFFEDLARLSDDWLLRPETPLNKPHNRQVQRDLDFVLAIFGTDPN